MRNIYIRFQDTKNFKVKVFRDRGMSCEITNSIGQTVILNRPLLKRSILFGARIEDHWGSTSKWFTDGNLTIDKRWEVS